MLFQFVYGELAIETCLLCWQIGGHPSISITRNELSSDKPLGPLWQDGIQERESDSLTILCLVQDGIEILFLTRVKQIYILFCVGNCQMSFFFLFLVLLLKFSIANVIAQNTWGLHCCFSNQSQVSCLFGTYTSETLDLLTLSHAFGNNIDGFICS